MRRKRVAGMGLGLVFGLAFTLFMLFIFGFSIKGTREYACALDQVRRSDMVAQALGEPIKPGFVAWLFSRETGGAQASATFATSISGPRGRGRIRVDSYRAPVGSYLLVQLKANGQDWVDVYSGSYPCR
jgi:hypothetical protein